MRANSDKVTITNIVVLGTGSLHSARWTSDRLAPEAHDPQLKRSREQLAMTVTLGKMLGRMRPTNSLLAGRE
jgi:hypothetical protein